MRPERFWKILRAPGLRAPEGRLTHTPDSARRELPRGQCRGTITADFRPCREARVRPVRA